MAERCPVCGKGTLLPKRIREEMLGVGLGLYDAEVCNRCGESFLGAKSRDKLEARAKELGLRGARLQSQDRPLGELARGPNPVGSGPIFEDEERPGSPCGARTCESARPGTRITLWPFGAARP
jgi:YgiT-type zinc finger domain-containing protein